MRCSECSKVVRPVVAIDIDGTLGDYHGHFLRFASRYLGLDDDYLDTVTRYHGEQPFKAWFCAIAGVDERTWYDIKLAYRQGAQKRSMPVYPYAAQLAQDVAHLGAEVWLTTTRPYLRLDNIDPDTRFWLDIHSIEYDHMLFDPNKYELLAERIDPGRLVAILEDEPEQWLRARAVWGDTIPIFRVNNYNGGAIAGLPAGFSVRSLREASVSINARINRWHGWQREHQK